MAVKGMCVPAATGHEGGAKARFVCSCRPVSGKTQSDSGDTIHAAVDRIELYVGRLGTV